MSHAYFMCVRIAIHVPCPEFWLTRPLCFNYSNKVLHIGTLCSFPSPFPSFIMRSCLEVSHPIINFMNRAVRGKNTNLIGASLSEPHTNGSAVREFYMYVYNYIYIYSGTCVRLPHASCTQCAIYSNTSFVSAWKNFYVSRVRVLQARGSRRLHKAMLEEDGAIDQSVSLSLWITWQQ